MRFEGTDTYVATPDLMLAVNAAIALERPLLIKGEPGTGKTMLAEEVARALSAAAAAVAHQVDDQGAAGALRVRRGVAAARFAAGRRDKVARHRQLHQARRAVGGVRGRRRRRCVLIDEVDKADIEFPNDLLRELDRMEFYVYETQQHGAGAAPAAGRHHQQQREGAARRLPAPLLLPLHPLSRPRDDDADRRRALPGAQEGAAAGGAGGLLQPARGARPQEEAVDLGAARLAQAAAGRGHPAGGAEEQRQEGADPAAARRAAQERAGRAPVRARRVHGADRAQREAAAEARGMRVRRAGRRSNAAGRTRRSSRSRASTRRRWRAAAADGELWRLWYTASRRRTRRRRGSTRRSAMREKQGAMPFVVRDNATGEIVGSTRYFNVDAAHRRLEIGHTWYAQRVQRTAINTECKLLLLAHAFETLDCIAVEFRTNFFNFQSRARDRAARREAGRHPAQPPGPARRHACATPSCSASSAASGRRAAERAQCILLASRSMTPLRDATVDRSDRPDPISAC